MFLYILKSIKDKGYYIGITKSLENRLYRHNQGMVLSTKHKKPFILIHSEWYNTRSEAYKREKYLKSLKKRKSLERIFKPPSSSLA